MRSLKSKRKSGIVQAADLLLGDIFILDIPEDDDEGPHLIVKITKKEVITWGFKSNEKGPFAYVTDGIFSLGDRWQIIRDGVVIF